MKYLFIFSLLFSVIGNITQLFILKYSNDTPEPLIFGVCVVWFFLSCIGLYYYINIDEEEFKEYVKKNSNKNKYHD